MKAKTRLFGEIEIEKEKIITMEQGIIGFKAFYHCIRCGKRRKIRHYVAAVYG